MTIKFIDLGFQMNSSTHTFAFSDPTATPRSFMQQSGNQYWSCWDDFQRDVVAEGQMSVLELESIKVNCPTWVME